MIILVPALQYPFFSPPGLCGSLLLLFVAVYMVGKVLRKNLERAKKKLPPDPHPQKYTYRSFLFEILFFILAVGALVFELGIMGYLS